MPSQTGMKAPQSPHRLLGNCRSQLAPQQVEFNRFTSYVLDRRLWDRVVDKVFRWLPQPIKPATIVASTAHTIPPAHTTPFTRHNSV